MNKSVEDRVYGSIGPDCWNGRWSQVNALGGGMAVELEVGELLAALVRTVKPGVIVETGTHKGFSSLMMASALQKNKGGHIYTIDLENHGVAALFAEAGLSKQATFVQANSIVAIPTLPIKQIDLLWLDADHTTESVMAELEASLKFLVPGSLVGFHDTIIDKREAEAVRLIKQKNPTWEHLSLVTARGVQFLKVA